MTGSLLRPTVRRSNVRRTIMLSLLSAALAGPAAARAHCDTLDGPVVTAARSALESGKVEPVLAWVQPADEGAIREAFRSARAARKSGGEAKQVADRWFLETLVRVHRAGEGAPFTGLKPAGGEADPAVAAVDGALAAGNAGKVEELLVHAVKEGLAARWARLAREKPPADDVAAGRRFVAAYVPFVHWAEAVRAAAVAGGHAPEPVAGGPAGRHEMPSHAH